MNNVSKNLSEIKAEIAPYNPKIVAVTKYFDKSKLEEAFYAGLRDFGENKVQDALTKIAELDEDVKKNSRFHLIGHLQSNKVKKAVGNFDLIHSVDSMKLAEAVSTEAQRQNLTQKVLLQVNNSGEETKSGFTVEELKKDFEYLKNLKNIDIQGLMTMAPFCASENELECLFTEIYELQQFLNKKYSVSMIEISMGMSNDYKIAAQCGATIIRIGTRLFKQ